MKTKSGKGKLIRVSYADLPRRTPADMERLRKVAEGPIDTSDMPERIPGRFPVRRDAQGRLPRFHRGPVCMAILKELGRRDITRYELWKRAREHCPTLPESAVYEFLRGQRDIGVNYLEALLQALDLSLARQKRPRAAKAAR